MASDAAVAAEKKSSYRKTDESKQLTEWWKLVCLFASHDGGRKG